MTVWVLFIWLSAKEPRPEAFLSFDTQAECQAHATPYKKAACVQVTVPK